MDGWIKSYRKMFDNPIVCKDAEHYAVWGYLLHHATCKPIDMIFEGQRITLKSGQLITSCQSIALKFNTSRVKVQRILKTFENEHQIEQQTTRHNRLITIVNWDKYQKIEQQNEQQVNNNCTTTEQQVNTNKNNKNNKKDKNVKNNTPLISPQGETWNYDKHSNLDNTKHYLNSGQYDKDKYIQDNKELWEAIKDWMTYKDARKPKSSNHYANDTSIRNLLNKIIKVSQGYGVSVAIEVIEDSIGNNYQGIIYDWAEKKKPVDRDDDLEQWARGKQ